MIAVNRPLCARRWMESAPVRWVICAVLLCAFAPSAAAQDFGAILRGPVAVSQPSVPHWSGFYVCGDIDFGNGNANFRNATVAPLAYALRNTLVEADFNPSSWSLLGSATVQSTFVGAFAGYDMQWQDVILGAEVTYGHPSVTATAAQTPMGRSFTQGPDSSGNITEYDINGTASASLHLTDYGTFRGRAGWVMNNIFLPYGFAGLAVGRANYSSTSTISWTQATTSPTNIVTSTGLVTVPAVQPSIPCTTGETCEFFAAGNTENGNAWLYGFDAGVGIDVALMRNVFLRGEFEYVHFFPMKSITLDFATARAGVGVKF